MTASPKITRIEITTFESTLENMGMDYNHFNTVFEPGGRLTRRTNVLQIHTDEGITGEYPGLGGPTVEQVKMCAPYLLGKDALERERIYNDTKRGLRHYDMTGVGVIDICLWDIAF